MYMGSPGIPTSQVLLRVLDPRLSPCLLPCLVSIVSSGQCIHTWGSSEQILASDNFYFHLMLCLYKDIALQMMSFAKL